MVILLQVNKQVIQFSPYYSVFPYDRDWPITACFLIKFNWNKARVIHLYMILGCFCAIMAEY